MFGRFMSLVMCASLAACAAQPKMLWLRLDGRSAKTNPLLAQQFEIDRTICVGDMQKANVSGSVFPTGNLFINAAADAQRSNAVGDVMRGCMAEKGYMFVPEDEAEVRRQAFEANAASIKQGQAPPKSNR